MNISRHGGRGNEKPGALLRGSTAGAKPGSANYQQEMRLLTL